MRSGLILRPPFSFLQPGYVSLQAVTWGAHHAEGHHTQMAGKHPTVVARGAGASWGNQLVCTANVCVDVMKRVVTDDEQTWLNSPHLASKHLRNAAQLWLENMDIPAKTQPHNALLVFSRSQSGHQVCLCVLYQVFALYWYWLHTLCPGNPHTMCVHVNISQSRAEDGKVFHLCL